MNKIGIMQGRLSRPSNGKIQSFPKTTWKEEFFKAKESGLSHIEWIFEFDEWEKNPISNKIGIEEIQEIIKKSGVKVYSICADYFMDIPFLRSDLNLRKELMEKLVWLVYQANSIEAKYIDLPFVDNSEIKNEYEYKLVKEFIEHAANAAKKLDVKIALETSLAPKSFKALLDMINSEAIVANYDTGNSSGIGYDCRVELKFYGNYITTVHIKDRLLNDGTKPLGTGSADFENFFYHLSLLKYNGPIVLQAAREVDGLEIETAIKNRIFVQKYLEKYPIV